MVDFAVMFGRGRPQNGIIVQPTKGYQVDPNDPIALAQFRDAIWWVCVASSQFIQLILFVAPHIGLALRKLMPSPLATRDSVKTWAARLSALL